MLVVTTCAAVGSIALAGGAAAVAKPSCRPKHEAAGCTLKNARYANSSADANFSVSLGRGEASAPGTVSCTTPGSPPSGPLNVLYGSYPQLVIGRPRVGRSYSRTLHQDVEQSAGVHIVGNIVLTVRLISAARAHLSYRNTYTQTVTRATSTGGVTSTTTVTSACKGTVSQTLKRVA